MRILVVLLVVLGCSKRASHDVIDDFRIVERSCLARFNDLLHRQKANLIDELELADAIDRQVLDPWRELHVRVNAASVPEADHELYATLRRYLEERATAWLAFNAALRSESDEAAKPHYATYHQQDAGATEDARALGAAFRKMALVPLDPLVPDAGVVFARPSPAPPGPAFFLVDSNVVLLDDAGFRVIATDVRSMDVLPDGTMWACNGWRAVHWDGARATELKTKIFATACSAAPDGTLWVFQQDLDRHGRDQLASFDGKTWTVATAPFGSGVVDCDQLLADANRAIFAIGRESFGGSDHMLAFVDREWRQIPLEDKVEHTWIDHLFRGGDGRAWLLYQVQKYDHYPLAVAPLEASGGKPPVFVDSRSQVAWLLPAVDRTGTLTMLDVERNTMEQGVLARLLPMPVARGGVGRWPGPFAQDAAGRSWLELVDGPSVIDREGHRIVFPRGSEELFRGPLFAIAVIGGGPRLPAPRPVVTRTITGTITLAGKPHANAQVEMCAEMADGQAPCRHALARWRTTTDAGGHFTLTDVPVWSFDIASRTTSDPDAHWKRFGARCCAGPAELGEGALEY